MAEKVRHLGVMLRVHREHRWLPRIARTLDELGRGRRLYVCVMQDRPSEEVRCRLAQLSKDLNGDVKVIDAPEPLVGDQERFMLILQIHFEALLEMGPIDAASLWDDDMWLTLTGRQELRTLLQKFDWHRVYARSAFLWDDMSLVNTQFPPHWQDLVFRVIPGDSYSSRLMQHAPQAASDSRGKLALLGDCLLNAGYLDEATRDANWDRYKKAGKIDAHTLTLVKRPRLRSLSEFCDHNIALVAAGEIET